MYQLERGVLRKLAHPSGTFAALNVVATGHITALWESSTEPPQVISLDITTGKFASTLLKGPRASEAAPWRSVTFESSDGESIQAWLSLPPGEGPFPAVVHAHGGPEAVMMEQFVPQLQMWSDNGFALLSVNYRGSTTFGRAFLEKIWGDLGHWEVEDLVAGRRWLIENGIAERGPAEPCGRRRGPQHRGYPALATRLRSNGGCSARERDSRRRWPRWPRGYEEI